MLSRLCENFEELDKVGASHLFWGDLERPDNTAEHLESVRGRINEFTDEVARIEDRRDAVLDKIGDKILEVLAKHLHPVSIVTKSTLVTRDVDLLAPLAHDGMASVLFSIGAVP